MSTVTITLTPGGKFVGADTPEGVGLQIRYAGTTYVGIDRARGSGRTTRMLERVLKSGETNIWVVGHSEAHARRLRKRLQAMDPWLRPGSHNSLLRDRAGQSLQTIRFVGQDTYPWWTQRPRPEGIFFDHTVERRW